MSLYRFKYNKWRIKRTFLNIIMRGLKVSEDVYDILSKVCSEKGLKQFEITNLSGNAKGEGFLGEIGFVTVEEKSSGKCLHLVIKKSFTDETVRDAHPIRLSFLNEIYFYMDIWPKMQQIQEGIDGKFDCIPEMLAVCRDEGLEKLVMVNLKPLGYDTFGKREFMDGVHVKMVFKMYGKFHAISYAMRKLQKEEYCKLTSELTDLYEKFLEKPFFGQMMSKVCEFVSGFLGEDEKVAEYFKKKFLTNAEGLFKDGLRYKGKNPVILHGDTWSNNCMCKYNEKRELIKVQLIDFQLARVGSPVHDLAYFLYASASSDVYNDLESYLKIYLHAFTEHYMKMTGEKPPLTLEELKSDWIKYNKFGLLMALVVWKMKSTDTEDVPELGDLDESSERFANTPCNTEFYGKICKSLIKHIHNLETMGF